MIDLRSDTVTQQTPEMREAMFNACVGDDVYQDDPTVNELERIAAEVLGKEAALFVTSGTMGNQLGLLTQTKRGDEIIGGADCHIVMHEVGAAAVLSGVNVRQLTYPNSIPVPELIEANIRPDDIHEPPTALICLENALANGRIVPLDIMEKVADIAHSRGIALHLDGARVFNAATALNVNVREITKYADTVSCCLSKGLCAPVGGIFASTREKVERARKYRKMLGGGMRQAGFLAAAGIIAITEMPKRLQEDHDNALYMAKRLAVLPGVTVDIDSVQIDMVFFKLAREKALRDAIPEKMLERGVIVGGEELGEFRFVTHYGVTRADVDKAVDAFADIIGK